MMYEGTITIQDKELNNPTLDVRGIFDSVNDNGELDFKYIECYFQENGKGTIHSRFWVVETEEVDLELSKIDELKDFK